jgi:hypothetical protein
LQELYSASSPSSRAAASSTLAEFVLKTGLRSLAIYGILEDLTRASKSKDAAEREASMVAFESLFRKVGLAGGADPFFVPLLPIILDRYQESGKAEVIKESAEKAAKQLIRLLPSHLAPKVIEELFAVIEGGAKWRSKAGALELLSTFAVSAKDQVAESLGTYVPRLSGAMRDTKPEVSRDGTAIATTNETLTPIRATRSPRELSTLESTFATFSPTPTSSPSSPSSSSAWPTLEPSPTPSRSSRPPFGFVRSMAPPSPSSPPSSPVLSPSEDPPSSVNP